MLPLAGCTERRARRTEGAVLERRRVRSERGEPGGGAVPTGRVFLSALTLRE